MGGKAAILLVLGFSVIFLVVGYNFGNLSNRAVDNSSDYFEESVAHQIAISGSNMALNEIFKDNDWDTGYNNLSFNQGILNVTVTDSVSTKTITSTGTYNGVSKEVVIKLQPSSYAKFAWYVGNMSSKEFITGDTVWGPFHSQSAINIGGNPVFMGKVTTLKGVSPDEKGLKSSGYDPKFYGGYESGVDIPLPVNYQFTEEKAAAVDGVSAGGSSYYENTDVWLTFNADGTVTHRTGSGNDSSTYSAPITEPLSTYAPNGVIYVKKGDVYMSGTLKGKATVVAGEASGIGNGNVYLVDDITYTSDPMTYDASGNKYIPNNGCTDMLGILATNNVRIVDNNANVLNKDIHIDASIFCAQGGVEMEDKTIPPSGTVYLRGGMIAAKEELLAITSSGTVTHGYKKHVVFDQRFMLALPPTFPNTGKFEIVSWLE